MNRVNDVEKKYKLDRERSKKNNLIKSLKSVVICGAVVIMISPKLAKLVQKVGSEISNNISISVDYDDNKITRDDVLKYAKEHKEDNKNERTIIDILKEKLSSNEDSKNYKGITRDQIIQYANKSYNKELTIENLSIEERLAKPIPQTYFTLSTDLSWLKHIGINTHDWFVKYGEMYGVDPYFLMAEGNQETRLNHKEALPGGKYYNGFAYGIFQFETPNEFSRDITAYNYKTGQCDTVNLNVNTASDEETNIQMAAMEMANHIDRYHGNIMLAFQANNYGIYMVDKIIEIYASNKGETKEQAMENYDDVGWLELVKDLHVNPRKYTSSWQYNTYGDGNYMNHVLQFFPGDKTYFMYDGKVNIFSFSELKMINSYELNNSKHI